MVVCNGGQRGVRVGVLVAGLLVGGSASAQPAAAPAPAPAPAPSDTVAPPPSEPTPPAEAAPPTAAPPEASAEPSPPVQPDPPVDDAITEAETTSVDTPADEAEAEAGTVDAPMEEPSPAEVPVYRVAEADWDAALEQDVIVELDDRDPVRGKLVASTPHAAVVIGEDGDVHTMQKSDVAALERPQQTADAAAVRASEETPAGETTPAKADWKRFGVFTSHGVAYAHWRTGDYQEGSAAYAGDIGIGYNWSRPWGAYLVLGGNAGARLADRTINGRFGHVAGMFRYRGKKRFVGMAGLALAWSRLDEPTRRVRDVSVSIPMKAMAAFPVADNVHVGVGIGYEVGFFAQGRIANALSFQATLAYW